MDIAPGQHQLPSPTDHRVARVMFIKRAAWEVTAAIAAELLVDGMDLSEDWCRLNFHASECDELAFALGLVSGKGSRIDDFSLN